MRSGLFSFILSRLPVFVSLCFVPRYTNSADHSIVCLLVDDKVVNCGTEEDTYGQQRPHQCQAKWYHRPGDKNRHKCVRAGTASCAPCLCGHPAVLCVWCCTCFESCRCYVLQRVQLWRVRIRNT